MRGTGSGAQRSTGGMVDYDRHSSAQQSIIRTQDQQIRDLVERIGPVDGEFRMSMPSTSEREDSVSLRRTTCTASPPGTS
jgi:hypothetical protein